MPFTIDCRIDPFFSLDVVAIWSYCAELVIDPGGGMTSGGGDKAIFSTHDAAKICHVTPMTVIRWIEEGKIPAFKTVGGHRRILRADLESFCRSRGMPFDPEGGGARGRILVVDADPATRDAVADAARAVDPALTIEMAADAFDAGRLVQRFRPDLVFLDQRTPGLDALEVCARLARDLDTAGTNVVVMTHAATPDAERAYRTRGAIACLAKPPAPAAVVELVRAVFRLDDGAETTNDAPSILVLDDDAPFCRGLSRDLEALLPGCRVQVCDTAMDALLAIGAERPSLILANVQLDGIEVARRIRGRLGGDGVTVLATGDRRDDLRAQALAAGARDYLPKPFSAAALAPYLDVAFVPAQAMAGGTAPARASRTRKRKKR